METSNYFSNTNILHEFQMQGKYLSCKCRVDIYLFQAASTPISRYYSSMWWEKLRWGKKRGKAMQNMNQNVDNRNNIKTRQKTMNYA